MRGELLGISGSLKRRKHNTCVLKKKRDRDDEGALK
jgi:hypothetical protein